MIRRLLKKRASLAAALALIGAVALLIVLGLPDARPRAAPEVEFVLLDGGKLTLAQLSARPVLVAFWATTCPPCIEELPDLVRLYRELRPRGFELVAVAAPYDPPLNVQRFVEQYKVPYPVALDVEGKVTRAFDGVPFIPAAFLIAPGGNVILHHTGKLDFVKLRRIIEAQLPSPAAQDQ